MKQIVIMFVLVLLPIMASARSEQFYNTLVNGIYYKFNTDDLTACVSYKSLFIGYYAEDPDWVEFERIYNDYSGDVVIQRNRQSTTQRAYRSLPDEFDMSQVAKVVGCSDNAARTMISRFCKDGYLERLAHGKYRKLVQIL